VVRILIYSHHAEDTQSRSGSSFDVTLDVLGLGFQGPVRIEEYRFDQDHNSPFKLARSLRDRPAPKASFAPMAYLRAEVEQIQKMCELQPSSMAKAIRESEGLLGIAARVAGNGCVFLKIEPKDKSGEAEKPGR
jgi:hypothetical protein